jgi:hypothetical protein
LISRKQSASGRIARLRFRKGSVNAVWDRIRLPRGLILAEKARIDLAEFASQPVGMSEVAILDQRARRPFGASEVWLRRAAQARRIARMLSVADAAILDAYAIECEAEARIAEQKLPIAA